MCANAPYANIKVNDIENQFVESDTIPRELGKVNDIGLNI